MEKIISTPFFIGLLIGIIIIYIISKIKEKKNESRLEDLVKQAEKDAQRQKKTLIIEAKEEVHNLKREADKEIKERKEEVKEAEKRMLQREESLSKRDEFIARREENLNKQEEALAAKESLIQDKTIEVENLKSEQLEKLSKIASLSKEKARDEVMRLTEESMKRELAEYIKDEEEKARIEAASLAKEHIINAMQRYSSSVAEEGTITTVSLLDDDLKGRIIGREGRNIRTLESITGVDLIIDDTPEVIVLSCFDPFRREIARQTLETLIKDGRIHPARIEEVYDKTVKEMNDKLMEYGNEALFELGIQKMNMNLVKLLGKMKFRYSYGQNALKHSVEVAHLSGLLAAQLGENVQRAKRCGLLHDIGKAVDHDLEGSHVELGAELAKKYNEPADVINAIESHHGDVAATSMISVIVAIADSLSASRPGARNDSLENYIKRISELEELASKRDGVEKAFAVQAGREIRVMVKPDKISDANVYNLARDIRKDIEDNLQYPGTIKVTVIRETRVEEEAK